MAKKLSMQQLADRLGVSKYTVSQALSGKPGVSEATRREVTALAGALGYTIKPSARKGKRKAGEAAGQTLLPSISPSISPSTSPSDTAPQAEAPPPLLHPLPPNRMAEREQRQSPESGQLASLRSSGRGENPILFIGLDEHHIQEVSFWQRVREGLAAGCRLQGLQPYFFTYGPEGTNPPELATGAFPNIAEASASVTSIADNSAGGASLADTRDASPVIPAASVTDPATDSAHGPAPDPDPAPVPAGFIIAGKCPLGLLLRLKRTGLPIVLADHEEPLIGADAVLNANAEAGRMACRHLLSQGCRRIAFIGRDSFAVSFRERWWGCRQALDDVKEPGGARHGGSAVTPPVQLKKWTVPYGSAALSVCRTIIERKLDAALEEGLPDGFVCANDDLALHLLAVLQRRRLNEGVRVVGIDNTAAGMNAAVPLTTVDLAKEALGIRAVEAFARKLRQPEAQPEKIILSARLVVRHSG